MMAERRERLAERLRGLRLARDERRGAWARRAVDPYGCDLRLPARNLVRAERRYRLALWVLEKVA